MRYQGHKSINHVKKGTFSIVAKPQSSRLTLRRLTGVPQEHFKFMFIDDD